MKKPLKTSVKAVMFALLMTISCLSLPTNSILAGEINPDSVAPKNPYAQLILSCQVKQDRIGKKRVKVVVYQENEVYYTRKVWAGRNFRLVLPLNHQYTIEYSAKGCFTNLVAINADAPEDALALPTYKFHVSMLPKTGEVHEIAEQADAFEFPVALIEFDEEYYDFAHIRSYTRDIRLDRLAKLVAVAYSRDKD